MHTHNSSFKMLYVFVQSGNWPPYACLSAGHNYWENVQIHRGRIPNKHCTECLNNEIINVIIRTFLTIHL